MKAIAGVLTRVQRLVLSSPVKPILCSRRQQYTVQPTSCRVLVTSSRNIYENLALEDWLYENADLQNESFLLIWRDEPCVVIGRHQNPWVECNVPYCEKLQVKVARRKSGGL